MAKEEKNNQRQKENSGRKNGQINRLKQETRHTVLAVVSFALALIFIFAMWGGAGPAGEFLYSTFTTLFGFGYILLPILGIILGISFIKSVRPEIAKTHTFGSILFLIS